MSPANRKLRGLLFLICLLAYLCGMAAIVGAERGYPLRAIIDVKYALGAYCLIAAVCVASMVVFSRQMENSAKRRE